MISGGERWPRRASSSAACSAIACSASGCLGFAAIERLLERSGAEPAVGVEEPFGAVHPQREIGFDDRFDRVGHLVGAEAAADDLAERRMLVAGAAERDLVEFRTLLFDAKNADMADVMMAAGIDAA